MVWKNPPPRKKNCMLPSALFLCQVCVRGRTLILAKQALTYIQIVPTGCSAKYKIPLQLL